MGSWRLDAGSADVSTYLVSGWASDGDAGSSMRWSTSERCRLLVPTPPAARADFVLEGQPFLAPPAVTSQRVWVFVQGLFAGFGRLSAAGDVAGGVPSAALEGSTMSVELVLPDAVAPSSVGVGADERLLALALRSMTLSWD
jgi:hypothetical protein